MTTRPLVPRDVFRDRRAGFTLVEVLAAFTVLAVFMLVLTRGLVDARTGADAGAATIEAENVARSLLEGPVPAELSTPGTRSGRAGDYAWTLRSEALGLPLPPPPEAETRSLYLPLRLTVTVEISPRRSLSVETVRLVKAEVIQ